MNLGIIGFSKGNGHPYSWSAIINGNYRSEFIKQSDHRDISFYLEANKDTLGIEGAKVTHIWTQDKQLSTHIANASYIDNVVDNISDMIGNVDAVILARDDPQNHKIMAAPFLEAEVPLFVDKPLAITVEDLNYFSEQIAQGKFLMSCSSLRYAEENGPFKTNINKLGEVELAVATGKKDWIKYGVHMLEGLFTLLNDPKAISAKHVSEKNGKTIAYIEFETGLLAMVNLFYEISPTFQISFFGRKGWKLIEYFNYYSMFKTNLTEFIRSVRQGKPRLDFAKTENIIRTLIAVKESLEQDGRTIEI